MYINLALEAILSRHAPENYSHFPMPENSKLGDILKVLNIREDEVMVAFIDGKEANLETALYNTATVSLCPYICGG